MAQLAKSEAQELLATQSFVALSTISLDLENYPFGSLVHYCLDISGEPLILVSNIAQHTKNLLKNPRFSLMVYSSENPDIQANPRLSYLGDIEKVSSEAAYQRYYRYFPDSSNYHKTHEFSLFRLRSIRGRYIGGFGKIYWVDPKDLVFANVFTYEEEFSIINHMNKDHQEALITYCKIYKGQNVTTGNVSMIGIDGFAMDLLIGKYQKLRIPFTEQITTADAARRMLIAMLNKSSN